MTKNSDILMNPNELVQFLKKPAVDFTHEDIIRFIEAKGISMLNFRYVADDGKLKSLNFVPFSRDHLEAQREYFEKDGVFPAGVIDNVVKKLKAFDDKGLSEKLYNRNEEIRKLVIQFLHCS